MARTIRRTRGKQEQLTTFVEVETRDGNIFFVMQPLTKDDPEHGRRYWDHHGDCRSGRHGVPRWYRKALNRRVASAEKKALHKALTTLDRELVMNPRKRNASYYWW